MPLSGWSWTFWYYDAAEDYLEIHLLKEFQTGAQVRFTSPYAEISPLNIPHNFNMMYLFLNGVPLIYKFPHKAFVGGFWVFWLFVQSPLDSIWLPD